MINHAPKNAQCLFTHAQVSECVADLAVALNKKFERCEEEIVALSLLNGGLIFSGMLLPKLSFPVYCDSALVSRYRDQTSGSDFRWHAQPATVLADRQVILLDDIYDRGITLQHVQSWCEQRGATHVCSAVLAWKQLSADGPAAVSRPDFYALQVPDAFVVGMGMDSAGKYRNLAGIYALQDPSRP